MDISLIHRFLRMEITFEAKLGVFAETVDSARYAGLDRGY